MTRLWGEMPVERLIESGKRILGFGVEALVDIALALQRHRAVGGQGLAEGAIVRAHGTLPHPHDEAVGGEVVLHHHVRRPALAPYVSMDIGSDNALRFGLAEQHFRIGPEVDVFRADEALPRPRPVRPIIEAGRIAEGGDGDRPVLPVIGDGPPLQRPGTIRIIGERVAIGIVSDGRATRVSEQQLSGDHCSSAVYRSRSAMFRPSAKKLMKSSYEIT